MKKKTILLYLCLCCSFCVTAQNHQVKARLNQLLFFENTEAVFAEEVDLFTTPRENDTGANINVDLTWLKRIKKHQYFCRVGYSRVMLKDMLVSVRDTFSISSLNLRNEKSLLLAGGIGHIITFVESNFEINANIGVAFQLKYGVNQIISSDYLNQSNTYFYGREQVSESPNSTSIGLTFECGFMYYLKERIGIGIDINNFLFWDRLNGTIIEDRLIYDAQRNVVDRLRVNHIETRNRFGKTFSFSIALAYKI